jgi:hypothetical protein
MGGGALLKASSAVLFKPRDGDGLRPVISTSSVSAIVYSRFEVYCRCKIGKIEWKVWRRTRLVASQSSRKERVRGVMIA